MDLSSSARPRSHDASVLFWSAAWFDSCDEACSHRDRAWVLASSATVAASPAATRATRLPPSAASSATIRLWLFTTSTDEPDSGIDTPVVPSVAVLTDGSVGVEAGCETYGSVMMHSISGSGYRLADHRWRLPMRVAALSSVTRPGPAKASWH